MEEQGNLERIDQDYIAAKMTENSSYGKDVAIGVTGIVTFNEYMKERGYEENNDDQEQQEQEEENVSSYFVVPVTLPDGSRIDVVVNNNGADIASIYTDKEGNVTDFELSSSIKTEIARSINGVETKLAPAAVLSALTPETLEELQKDLAKDQLVPQSNEEVVEKVKEEYPDVPVSSAAEIGDDEEEIEETAQEIKEAEDEIPAEIRDDISRICSENNLDIRDLKEVMVVSSKTLTTKLPNSGLNQNGENVNLLKFRDKSMGLKDRVVMSQPGSEIVDERQYDDFLSDYMTEHRGQVPERETKDPHDTIYYTDIHGNTSVQEIKKEPMDLTCTQKEQLMTELEKLNNSTTQIMNSNLSPESKAEELTKINGKRLDLFKEYGIEVGTVTDEIQADIEITEEIANNGQEEEEAKNEEDSESSRWLKAFGKEHELPEGPWDNGKNHF